MLCMHTLHVAGAVVQNHAGFQALKAKGCIGKHEPRLAKQVSRAVQCWSVMIAQIPDRSPRDALTTRKAYGEAD